MDSIDKEDMFSSVKKYFNTNSNDENSMSNTIEFDASSAKSRKTRIRKLVDGFSRLDELEHVLEELEDSMHQLDS